MWTPAFKGVVKILYNISTIVVGIVELLQGLSFYHKTEVASSVSFAKSIIHSNQAFLNDAIKNLKKLQNFSEDNAAGPKGVIRYENNLWKWSLLWRLWLTFLNFNAKLKHMYKWQNMTSVWPRQVKLRKVSLFWTIWP